jgi:hypothetical protein
MGENKGRGVKGRGYDELSGVGTSSAGITGTTGNLNTGGRDGGIGEPPPGDAGNRQTGGRGQSDGTPALGNAGRAAQHSRQNNQGAAAGASRGGPGAEEAGDQPEGGQTGRVTRGPVALTPARPHCNCLSSACASSACAKRMLPDARTSSSLRAATLSPALYSAVARW